MTEIKDFRFRFDRALQATAYLVKKAGDEANVIRLMKLLYIADREYLLSYGEMITGDRIFAMDRGPVLSIVLDLIRGKGKREQVRKWAEYLQTIDSIQRIRLLKEPNTGSLCCASREMLDKVYARYGHLDKYEIVDLTHDFPEWIKYYNEGTSTPIPWVDILQLHGKQSMVKTVMDYIEMDEYQHALFGGKQ